MITVPDDPQALAEATAQSMYERDDATLALGMKILSVAPGSAQIAMTVRQDMLNGHKSCHGGLIFALADSTFAFACNSRNVATVASGCTIDYLAPAFLNDTLIATASEYSLAGRMGVYDVQVHNQDGRKVAIFRGRSYRISGTVIGGEGVQKQAVT